MSFGELLDLEVGEKRDLYNENLKETQWEGSPQGLQVLGKAPAFLRSEDQP